ncbi:MAG: MEDS domain-containing protein [Spirochaetia bacterium]|nr:MEDS domain-containing protein [Spirochaetia bacterium]MCF7946433.1 MEDS domain-containing protein [Spirochaetia bacterium]
MQYNLNDNISVEELKGGDHLALLYRNNTEWADVVLNFLTTKIDQNALCMYIKSEHSTEDLRKNFIQAGKDFDSLVHSQQLRIFDADTTYLKDGKFNAVNMVKKLKEMIKEVENSQYSFLAVTGETGWVNQQENMSAELVEYENLLNEEIFPFFPIAAVCQYNIEKLPSALSLDIIRSHPFVVWKGETHKNPYYINPKLYKGMTPKQELETWLYNIENLTSSSVYNLKHMLDQTILALAKATEKVDRYTSGHQVKVAKLSKEISSRMEISEEKQEAIWYAAMLHDIGKIAVPTEILNKKGQLFPHEWNLIRRHPRIGYDILHTVSSQFPIDVYILQHHERIDGSGYPLGLVGEKILPESQIISVADTVEAMTNDRPYRKSLGLEKTMETIKNERGIKFLPEIVDICIEIFSEDPNFLIMK